MPIFVPRDTPDYSRLAALYQQGGDTMARLSLQRGQATAATLDRLGALFSGFHEFQQQRKVAAAATAMRATERADDRAEKQKDRDERKAERDAATTQRNYEGDRGAARYLVDNTQAGPVDPILAQLAMRFPETAARFSKQTTLPATVTPGAMGAVSQQPTETGRMVLNPSADDAMRTKQLEDAAAERATTRQAAALAAGVDDTRQALTLAESMRHNRVMENKPTNPNGEPLEAVIDPKTGESVLLPRSQAKGMRPATTREQPTEDERKSVGFYKQMKEAMATLDALEDKLTEQDLLQMSLPQEKLIGIFNRGEMSENAKRYFRAFEQFTEARMRPVSGAAISDSEFARDRRTYARQYQETPALAADRRTARTSALETLRVRGARAMPKDVVMVAPDGTEKAIPADQVDHYKGLGAKVKS